LYQMMQPMTAAAATAITQVSILERLVEWTPS
jgi:hypothetical protein